MRKIILFLILWVILAVYCKSQTTSIRCKVFDTNSSKIPDNIIKTLTPDNMDQLWFATGDCFFGGNLENSG
jgi:hypothetical protein